MAPRSQPTRSVLEITEEPVPLAGWQPGTGAGSFGALEQDLRAMMRRAAAAEFARGAAEAAQRRAQSQHLLALLEVMDAFERVFRNVQARDDQLTPQFRKWIGNFRTICRMLGDALAEQGVARIENLDRGFDPVWHKAVETIVDPGRTEGEVVEEVRAGYMWRDQVLRKSEVVAVRNPAGTE